MAKKAATTNEKLSYAEFTKRSIVALRDVTKSKGMHSVYSGFNQAFKEYYGEGVSPKDAVDSLHDAGTIVRQFRRGGAMLFLPGEEPVNSGSNGKGAKALQAILA